MQRFALVIEYDGTGYCGWQRQKNALSIQQTIEECWARQMGETVRLTGSGRTDSGVHAWGQVAHFDTCKHLEAFQVQAVLNTALPKDIVVRAVYAVGSDFHARFDALEKTYEYYILNRTERSALLRGRVCHLSTPLDVSCMHKAAQAFIGTHDFRAFQASGSSVKDTVRTVFQAEVEEADGLIRFLVRGNGFLYNMVRIMAGTLVEAGAGKRSPEAVAEIVRGGQRGAAGKTLAAAGLYLKSVRYPAFSS